MSNDENPEGTRRLDATLDRSEQKPSIGVDTQAYVKAKLVEAMRKLGILESYASDAADSIIEDHINGNLRPIWLQPWYFPPDPEDLDYCGHIEGDCDRPPVVILAGKDTATGRSCQRQLCAKHAHELLTTTTVGPYVWGFLRIHPFALKGGGRP
jgi:hypothetical protein